MPPGKVTGPDKASGMSRNSGKDPKTQRVPSEKIKISANVAKT